MAIFDDMIKKLPAVMQQPNVKRYYYAISALLEDFDQQMIIFENIHLLNTAEGEWLDKLGVYVNVFRDGDNDDDYRARIKVEYYRFNFVPTLDNFLEFIKTFTGFYPQTIETQNHNHYWQDYVTTTWQESSALTWEEFGSISIEEPAYIKFNFGNPIPWSNYTSTTWGDHTETLWRDFGYVFETGFNPDILDEFDKLGGAGIRVEDNI